MYKKLHLIYIVFMESRAKCRIYLEGRQTEVLWHPKLLHILSYYI